MHFLSLLAQKIRKKHEMNTGLLRNDPGDESKSSLGEATGVECRLLLKPQVLGSYVRVKRTPTTSAPPHGIEADLSGDMLANVAK